MSLYYSYCYNVKRFRRLRILYQKKVMNPLYRSQDCVIKQRSKGALKRRNFPKYNLGFKRNYTHSLLQKQKQEQIKAISSINNLTKSLRQRTSLNSIREAHMGLNRNNFVNIKNKLRNIVSHEVKLRKKSFINKIEYVKKQNIQKR